MRSYKFYAYLFFLLQLSIILFFWFRTAGNELNHGSASILITLGRLAGLLAVLFILLQVILRARITPLERVFGYETLNYWHKKNGYLAFFFFLLHPVFITIGYAQASQKSYPAQFLLFIQTFEGVLLAFLGWLILITVIITSVYIVRIKMRYESWYFMHLATYIAILLAFFHQILTGSDLQANSWFRFYWLTLYTLVIGSLLYWRFYLMVYLYSKHRFYVKKVVKETGDTVSIYIKGNNIKDYKFEPGQFTFLRFLTKDLGLESHPFSFSTVPGNDYLRFTVKSAGDFTQKIKKIKPKTAVVIDQPHGAFTERFMIKTKVVFFAGGVGITPIRSLIEGINARKKTVLFYANKTSKDIIFKKELDQLSLKYKFPIYHIISREEGYKGIKGRINLELIKKYITNFQNYEIYLCGPISMAKSLSADLQSAGVPKKQIHFEEFAL